MLNLTLHYNFVDGLALQTYIICLPVIVLDA